MPPRPNPHQAHLLRLFALEKRVEAAYLETIKAFAQQHQLFATHAEGDKPFTFAHLPRAQRAKVRGLVRQLHAKLHTHLSSSITEAWEAAERNNDTLAIAHFGRKWHSLPPEVKDQYLTHNAPALEAFLQRKAQGLDLSQRVWQVAEGFEQELELALQVGIAEGSDAEQLSRNLRQYLRQPERLFRRVRDKFGVLHLSKAAKAYKPGRGVYRSSFKNARRLAATETNIAYCTADHLRWQQLDFVVGIRIALSNNHTCLGRDGKPHRFTDICDQLAGDYPKSFKFVGWHPHCRCIATPILKTPEELESDAPSSNEVKELPEGFQQWVEANKERIAASEARGTLPYFIRDNKEAFVVKPKKFDYDKPNDALEEYISGHGMWINNYLRGRVDMGKLFPEEEEYLDQLTQATSIEKVGEGTLWRTVDAQAIFGDKLTDGQFDDLLSHYLYGERHPLILKDIEQYLHMEGKEIEDKGFMSTTKSEQIAKDFWNYTGARRPMLLKIKTNANTTGVDVERYTLKHKPEVEKNEPQKEVLLQRGQRLRILSIGDRKGYLCAEVELLDREAKSLAKKTPLDIAKERHAKRTKEKEEEIRKRWEERKKKLSEEAQIENTKLKRETLSELKNRLGKKLPPTLKNLDKAISAYELSEKYGQTAKDYKEHIEKLMSKVFDTHDFGMNIEEHAIEKVLSTWFKNTFEVGGGNGYVGSTKTTGKIELGHGRLRAAHEMFGLSEDLSKQLKRSQYEKYGSLLDHDILESLHKNVARCYGQVEVRFKKDKVLATWTAGDSLGERWQPSLCSDPKSCSFDSYDGTPTDKHQSIKKWELFKREHIEHYLELQYHGKITPDCVESLSFPYDLKSDTRVSEYTIAQKWKDKGAKIYYINAEGKLEQL